MILASCHQVEEDHYDGTEMRASSSSEAYNCSQPNAHSLRGLPLENVTFHVVELASGRVTHRTRFRRDFIQLVHHSGVYLYKDLFAVLSIQNQAVHVFQLKVRALVPVCSLSLSLSLSLSHARHLNHSASQLTHTRARALSFMYLERWLAAHGARDRPGLLRRRWLRDGLGYHAADTHPLAIRGRPDDVLRHSNSSNCSIFSAPIGVGRLLSRR